jgi:hypothetical protein
LTVTPATLVSLAISPSTPSVAKGINVQFTATGTYSDSSTQNLTALATWSSGTAATATISNAGGSQGLASTVNAGTTTIGATYNPGSGAVSASTLFTVTAATISSIEITPAASAIANGTTTQFTATGHYSDTSTQDLTNQATWSSSLPTIATVSNAAGSRGFGSAVNVGGTTITAIFQGISGSTTLQVTQAVLNSITVIPVNPSIKIGLGQQFHAQGSYSNNTVQDITTQVTWASTVPGVATVSNALGTQGFAKGVTTGNTTVSATLGAIAGTTNLNVHP